MASIVKLSFLPLQCSCRSFAKPPQQVQTVCECVVIMRGYKEISWKTAKGMMSDTNFLNTLKNMDVDGITVGQVNVHTHIFQ